MIARLPVRLGLFVSIFLILFPGILISCSNQSKLGTTQLRIVANSTITIGIPNIPANFNPYVGSGDSPSTDMIMQQLWPGVFRVDSNFQYQLNSSLVTSTELISINPQKVVYKLNPDAKWSDGVPVSSQDFIYTWEANAGLLHQNGDLIQDEAVSFGWKEISSVEEVSKDVIEVDFKVPYGGWESLFSYLLPFHIAQKTSFDNGFTSPDPHTLLSEGPFEIATHSASDITLVRNRYFSGPKSYIKKVIFKVISNGTEATSDVTSGLVNFVYGSFTCPALNPMLKVKGWECSTVLSLNSISLMINPNSQYGSLIDFRRLVWAMIDRSQLTSDVIGSYVSDALPLDGYFGIPEMPSFQEVPTLLDQENLSEVDSLEKSLGLVRGDNGFFEFPGVGQISLNIVAPVNDPFGWEAAEYVSADLQEQGLANQIVSSDNFTTLAQKTNDYSFDIAIVPSAGFATYAENLEQLLNSEPLHVNPFNGSWNTLFGVYVNPGMNYDETFSPEAQSILSDLSFLDAKASLGGLSQKIAGDYLVLPLFQEPVSFLWSKRLQNVSIDLSNSTPCWDLSTWVLTSG